MARSASALTPPISAAETPSASAIRIDTGRLLNAGGTLIATGADLLVVSASDGVDNRGGTLAGNGALDLQSGFAGQSQRHSASGR
ncbi:hypothetical protein [Edwardsiella hoshinae]|uniref:hypothetical protein n=1 Tax=Edwardsiella hoshinae TaxID=93378 RepID=UPI000E1C1FC8|nr:hypothetical protein [Edwardsiella hoshinae]